jgi:hypothetical protein
MAAKKRNDLGFKSGAGVSREELVAIHRLAEALEKGKFDAYISILQDTRKLFWKSFVAGAAKGFGAVIGATVVVAVAAALLAWIGPHLPDPAGDTVENTGEKIQQPAK